MKFVIKNNLFEGPIATLHEMIEKRSLSISELSLAEITDEFISFIKELQELEDQKKELTGFITIASILILIKSKTLLPENLFEVEETRSIDILENQLKAYAIIKDATKFVKSIYGQKPILVAGANKKDLSPVFLADKSLEIETMQNYILNRLQDLSPLKEKKTEVKLEKKVTIADAISHMRSLIKKLKKFNLQNAFESNFGQKEFLETKKTVVVLFLALLELARSGEIEVLQENHFGEIQITESF